jgi:L-ribulose-5-phosphate 4-epimerase
MVVVNLDGKILEGDLKPSSDKVSYLYIYRQQEDVNSGVHTHSRFAIAFAAVNMPIPIYLTAQGDEFGCEITCAGFDLKAFSFNVKKTFQKAQSQVHKHKYS